MIKSSNSLLKFPWVQIVLPYQQNMCLYSYLDRPYSKASFSLAVTFSLTLKYKNDFLFTVINFIHILSGFIPVNLKESSTCSSNFDVLLQFDVDSNLAIQLFWQMGWYHFLHYQLSLSMKQYSTIIYMWCVYLKSLFCLISVSKLRDRLLKNKFNVAWMGPILFKVSISRSVSHLPVQPSVILELQIYWDPSYPLAPKSHIFLFFCDNMSYRFSGIQLSIMACGPLLFQFVS
jgi:hypothetical protein